MAATSASTYAAVGPRLRWPTVLLAAVITWCVGVVLTPLALYLWVRLKWPMLPELHEFVSPSHTYLGLWGLNCGIAAVGALLLLRRNSLAVWPIAVLAAWRVGYIAWHMLRGSFDALPRQSSVWLGLASYALVLAAIVILRRKRVLQ